MSPLTVAVLILVTVFVIVYDIAIYFTRGIQSTISVTLWDLAKRYPVIPFALGVVSGHLFWLNSGACP